jgi:hypothetical protein
LCHSIPETEEIGLFLGQPLRQMGSRLCVSHHWDAQDAAIKSLCQAFIDSTIPASNRAKPRTSLSLPKRDGQVTLLTRSGLYVITAPPESVVGAGAALMMELMKRTKEKPANQAADPTAPSGRGSP